MADITHSTHEIVMAIIEQHLNVQLETFAHKTSEGAQEYALLLEDVLSYPPISYFTKVPPYIGDIDEATTVARGNLINFVNYVAMDWSVNIRTRGDGVYSKYVSAVSDSMDELLSSDVLQEDYVKRLDIERADEIISLTYYLLSCVYRKIAIQVGVNNGREATKPTN